LNTQTREYYAAANSFSGFRSFFDEVFERKNFERIFILKGGPGTGKSTLMKKTLQKFSEMGFACDAIYCSSDPESLDGIIIDGKVAVIDGTAPHETDTRLPGAADEIINLGESWSSEILSKKRKEIEELNKIKKQNYSSAYKYLAFSGNIHDYKLELIKKCFDFKSAENFISALVKSYKESKKSPSKLLISAFSKYGHTRRDFLKNHIEKQYSIRGKYGEESIFLLLLEDCCKDKFSYIRLLSPFREDMSDGIYFNDENALFLLNSEKGELIDTSVFLKGHDAGEIGFLKKSEEELLLKSKEAFMRASDAHFLLEDIYKAAMDFDKNDEIYQKLSEKIRKILFKA